MADSWSKDQAKKIVEPRESRLSEVFRSAIADLNQYYEKTRHLYNPSEMATIMHAHVRDHAKRLFPNEYIDKKGQAFRLIFDGTPQGIEATVEVKLKKINWNLISANIPTSAVKAFNNQQIHYRPIVQMGLFGEDKIVSPPIANLIAAYIPNQFWTGLDRICVTFPTELRKSDLLLEIALNTQASSATVIQLPIGQVDEIPKTAKRKRVVPREAQNQQDTSTASTQRIKRQSHNNDEPRIIKAEKKKSEGA